MTSIPFYAGARALPVALLLTLSSAGSVYAAPGDTNDRLEQQEEELRRLTGKVEEMGFQIHQLEDKLQRLSKDTSFRLKELEGGTAASSATSSPPSARPAGSTVTPVPVKGEAKPLGSTDSMSRPLDNEEASSESGEKALYETSLTAYNQKDYGKALSGFQKFLETSGNSPLSSNAYYWMGETYFAKNQYKEAAGAFLEGYKKFPQGNKADHNLYRLGTTLFQLGKKTEGCATLREAKTTIQNGNSDQKAILLKRIEQVQQKNTCP